MTAWLPSAKTGALPSRPSRGWLLLIAHDERGPGDDLKLQFEAASLLNPGEKNVIRSVIGSIVLRNTVKAPERRFSAVDFGGSPR